jgi:hypothetical protein
MDRKRDYENRQGRLNDVIIEQRQELKGTKFSGRDKDWKH